MINSKIFLIINIAFNLNSNELTLWSLKQLPVFYLLPLCCEGENSFVSCRAARYNDVRMILFLLKKTP